MQGNAGRLRTLKRGRNATFSGALRCVATQLPLLSLTFLGIIGCAGSPDVSTKGPYTGETLPLIDLTDRLNQNNNQITSLWAKGGFEADLRESRQERSQFVNGDLSLLYLQPDKLLLKGKKAGAGDVFELGSDGETFWLALPTENLLYIGTFEGLDPEAAKQLPVRPDLVLEVLGITPLSTDLLEAPVPSLRFNPDSDAYMLTWAEPYSDDPPPRWSIVKEVWYDRETLLPTVIILFDRDGRPVLRAYLSDHKPIEDTGEGQAPVMATRYDLYFPDTGSTMRLDIDPDEPGHDLLLKRGRFPMPRSFNPPDRAAFDRIVDLDRPSR